MADVNDTSNGMNNTAAQLQELGYDVLDREDAARLVWRLREEGKFSPKATAEILSQLKVVHAEWPYPDRSEWKGSQISDLIRRTKMAGYAVVAALALDKESDRESNFSDREKVLWQRALEAAEKASIPTRKLPGIGKRPDSLSSQAQRRRDEGQHNIVRYEDARYEAARRAAHGDSHAKIAKFFEDARIIHHRWRGEDDKWIDTNRVASMLDEEEARALQQNFKRRIEEGEVIEPKIFEAVKAEKSSSPEPGQKRKKRAAAYLIKKRPDMIVAPKDAVRHEAMWLRIVVGKTNRQIAQEFSSRPLIHEEWAKRSRDDAGREPWYWSAGMISNLITGCDIGAKTEAQRVQREKKKAEIRAQLDAMRESHARGDHIPTHPELVKAVQAKNARVEAMRDNFSEMIPQEPEPAEKPAPEQLRLEPKPEPEQKETAADELRIVLTIDGRTPRLVESLVDEDALLRFEGLCIDTILAPNEINIDLTTDKMKKIPRRNLYNLYGLD